MPDWGMLLAYYYKFECTLNDIMSICIYIANNYLVITKKFLKITLH